MEVLRVDFKSPEALDSAAATGHAQTSGDAASVWTRLFRHLTLQAPLTNRLLPKVKAGRLMLEVGAPPEWRHFDVALAGSTIADLGLYYYADKRDAAPLGCVRLHSAHIDVLEEVVMVVTADKTWFLCAEHSRNASDWAEAICAAIERVSVAPLLSSSSPPWQPRDPASAASSSPTRRRLSNTVSAATLREIQSRDARTRVDEFVEVFVRSRRDDVRMQALQGALSWSCMRNVAWKLWLEYIPSDVPFGAWAATVNAKRQRYASLRASHTLFANALAGVQTDEDFIAACETSDDALVYDIYKDVRRTRGAMAFFRLASVQSILVRVLFTYSMAHPEVSYNQGMGELLATVLYLLHLEQWPAAPTVSSTSTAVMATSSALQAEPLDSSTTSLSPSASFEKLSSSSDVDETSYVYVESCAPVTSTDGSDTSASAALDQDAFLKLPPFAGRRASTYSECCRGAVEQLVHELTDGAFIEHDAFVLLEELMVRMAGTYCPDAPLSIRSSDRGTPGASASASSPPPAASALSPLDAQMSSIHHHILSRCDPPLARHLAALGVEPQMFSLRWVRVLMAREFDVAHVWPVWDAIFSVTPSDFSFINLLCVAAVRAFRDEILAADDATSVLLCFRDVADRIDAARLVANARELYDALLIAAAIEASSRFAD